MAEISKDDLRKKIAAILKDASLSVTSAKKVRQELEEKLDANLQSRKKKIDDLVMEFVSAKQDKKKGKKSDSEEEEKEEEEKEEEEEEEKVTKEDAEDDKKKKRASTGKKPAAKKAKKGSVDEYGSEQSKGDSEEEYYPKKAKPIKTRKLPPKKKGSESDSDKDWAKKKGKKGSGGGGTGGDGTKTGSGYTKTMALSPELAALVCQDSMARHEVVKQVWYIINEKDLYDTKNKQYTICDDALMKVLGVKRFRTFGMMKCLKSHFIS